MLYIDRITLTDLLTRDVLNVTFTKNGTDRVIRCTLRADIVPPKVEQESVKSTNENVMPVYDLDAGAFRSFKLDSVTKVMPADV
jgi:hypothetical protein